VSDTPPFSSPPRATVGVLGGTGPLGRGLARRLASVGHPVVLGSRDAQRARDTAVELREGLHAGAADTGGTEGSIDGEANAEAARAADIVIVAVPYDGHAALLEELAAELDGKIVVDCVNPLGFDKAGAYPLDVPEGSAALQAAALLPGSRVVAAFHHVSAVLLEDLTVATLDTDVLVLGDDRAATDAVRALADSIPGMRGIYAGRLRNTRQVEALTANLISVNRRYQAHAGLRITDV